MATRNYWFGHKWLGAGLAPASWQGWLCLIVFIVVLGWTLTGVRTLAPDPATANAIALVLVLVETAVMFWIVWVKRDTSRVVRWRWFGGN
ncbi:MAG TPA: hypothetical protein VGL66_03870 [Caulobacteraceae bacterium]|jgi:hypothetical protein